MSRVKKVDGLKKFEKHWFRQTLRSHDSLSTIFSNKHRFPMENEKSGINRKILMWIGRTW